MSLASVPGPITWSRALTGWQLDPLVCALTVLAALLYLQGARRLAQRGRHWPVGRTAAFLAGLAVAFVALDSVLERYDDVLFSAHALQHLLLGMLAPPLLALGAPVTLALQASSRSTQTGLLRVLRSRPVAVLTYPLVTWMLFSGTLVALYFTPLLELSLRHPWVHVVVHLHFLFVGVLFFWTAVGLDPLRWRIPLPGRALYAFTAVPFHAFVGVAILSSTSLLAGGYYAEVHRSWGSSPLADQHTAGGILWAGGDLLGVAVLLVIVVRWLLHEQAVQERSDRAESGYSTPFEPLEKAGALADGSTE